MTTSTSVVAINQAGQIAWITQVPMNKTWPIVFEIDSSHMVVEGSCLDPATGKLLWASSAFCADTGIFTANFYSPQEKLFFVKDNSYVTAGASPTPPRLQRLFGQHIFQAAEQPGSASRMGTDSFRRLFPKSANSPQRNNRSNHLGYSDKGAYDFQWSLR